MSINQPSLDETGAVTHLLRGRSDAGCPPGSAPLCKRTATSPGRGQDPQRAPRDTHPAPQRLSPAHVFLSSQLTLSQERGEQRQLYITMRSASAHTPVLPSHPSCRDLGGAKPCLVPPLTTALTQARSVQGLPGLSVGRAAEKKHSPHPHTMSRLSEEPEEALGEWDRPRRQAPEAAGGDARGSCYRELCACDPTAAVFEEPQL